MDSGPRLVYLTGYANDESTQLTSVPIIGGVVCFTEAGGIKGRGIDVTKPATAVLSNFAGIIVDMDPALSTLAAAGDGSGVTAGKVKPGWLKVVNAGFVQAMTKANMTKPSTAMFPIGPVNGSWNLEAITPSVATGAANLLALAQCVALALETADTSSTAALKWVKLGGIVGGFEV